MIDSSEIGADSILANVINSINIPNIVQNVLLSPLKNTYFPWLCLLLLVSSDNLRRPLIYYAISHWTINTLGDVLYQSVYLYKPDYEIFPFSNRGYILSIGISSVLYLLSEILGDWYLLLRTKVLIRNNKKGLTFLYIACILFNIMKVAEMVIYLRYVPFPTDPELTKDMGQIAAIYQKRFSDVIDQRLNVLIFQQVTSLIYDVLVIIMLKKNVFTKNDVGGLSKNTFLNKFKQLSEYRIYLGVIIAVVASPFIFAEVVLLKSSQEDYYNVIYIIRSKLLNFFYVFMYIDQISLRFFVERTNVVRSTYNNVSNNSANSNHKSYYNNNNKSSSNTTLTYNKSNTSLRSLNNNNNIMNYNNPSHNYNNISVSEYNNPNNYRYNNYNIINSFNNSNSDLFYNNNDNSVSDIFYNKLKYQNQIEYDDNKFLIDKKIIQHSHMK
ncbi:hypothetical protein BCR32DRAFT_285450 [Anaeromyces robustus]|uniref:Uncharacterized protein n=1 Tax=Anaeromyces robustus TaxID=1754192 RepID=A0A1Y1WPC8_9FUNG|nr:hypothetical protein BCR32DRAFT_285450 [Anaeromyces robustus]|eukprot:ORX75148.1 hypothetical protein BCR32DRAFT_285450 [Anaeromyces robustus]